jgi:hypothetical protein
VRTSYGFYVFGLFLPGKCALLPKTGASFRTSSIVDGNRDYSDDVVASEAGMFWRIVEGIIVALIVVVAMAIVGLMGYLLLPPASATTWLSLLAPVLFTGLVVAAILVQTRRA